MFSLFEQAPPYDSTLGESCIFFLVSLFFKVRIKKKMFEAKKF